MSELKPRIHDETNGLDYVLAGDYYIPVIELPESDDRPIGLADLDEQARERYRLIVRQMAQNEDVTEELKRQSQWEWVRAMNSIVSRTEEIIMNEIINI